MKNPDFILIGEGSPEAGERLKDMYLTLNPTSVIQRMSPSSAEITKLSVNCFVTTKIAFANMIGDVADLTPGANKFDILRAVGFDSRVGHKYLKPGYAFGGPCFPRDNRALGGYIKKVGISPLIPNATDQSNNLHTKFQTRELKKQQEKSVVFTGIAYKDNCTVPIIEESAKLKMAESLAKDGVEVTLRDIPELLNCVRLEYGNLFQYEEI